MRDERLARRDEGSRSEARVPKDVPAIAELGVY